MLHSIIYKLHFFGIKIKFICQKKKIPNFYKNFKIEYKRKSQVYREKG